MKNVNALIEEENQSDIESDLEERETSYKQTDNEIESDNIINEDAHEYREEEKGDHVITRRNNNISYHILIGQQEEVQDFIGPVTQ